MPEFMFLDLETTGLESEVDQITEVAWKFLGEELRSYIVKHDRIPGEWSLKKTDYIQRILLSNQKEDFTQVMGWLSYDIRKKVSPVYLVGANPAFDHSFLAKAGVRGYHYRLIDVEVMAMQALHLIEPPGLKDCLKMLGLPENNAAHTASGDVLAVEMVFKHLRSMMSQ